MIDCNICAETKNNNFKCVFCNFETCFDCFSTFVLEGNKEASCMNCKKQYSYYYLKKNFSSTEGEKFMEKYKEFLIKLFYEREIALEGVNIDKEEFQLRRKQNSEKKKQYQTELDKVVLNLKELRAQFIDLPENTNDPRYPKSETIEHVQLRNKCKEVIAEKNNLLQLIESMKEKEHIAKVIMKCPKEDCAGYVKTVEFNETGDANLCKCSVCSSEFCSVCKEKFHRGKECDEGVLATLKEIEDNAKPCPTCKTKIIRAYGCNHMFCTNCKTTFDWATGRKNANSTNPHYYEYLRELRAQRGIQVAPREPGDVPCGGLPELKDMTKLMKYFYITPGEMNKYRTFNIILKKCIEYISKPSHQPEYDFEDLRMKHVTGSISDASFKKMIFNRELSNFTKLEIVQIIEAFIAVCIERIVSLMNHFQSAHYNRHRYNQYMYPETMRELETVRVLSGTALEEFMSSARNPILKSYD